jgi:hypothetical protein
MLSTTLQPRQVQLTFDGIDYVGHVFDNARSPHGETLKTPTLASWSSIRDSTGHPGEPSQKRPDNG